MYSFHYVGLPVLNRSTTSSSLHSIDAPASGLRLELVPVPICDGEQKGRRIRSGWNFCTIGWLQVEGVGMVTEVSAWGL